MADERTLVRSIEREILARWPDAWVFKVVGNPYQMAGVPDLLVVVQGRLIGLEVKHQRAGESVRHAKGRATPVQRAQIEAIRRAGGVAEVVTSVEEVVDIVLRVVVRSEIPNEIQTERIEP